jgi:DNA modification methylase
VHRWVPWIAGFSAGFVEAVFGAAVSGDPREVTVLDPFAGVGTTLVEGLKRGYNVIGFEINPYAALACEVKLSCDRFSLKPLTEAIDKVEKLQRNRWAGKVLPTSKPPSNFRTKTAFFSPAVEREVLLLQDFIAEQGKGFVGKVLKVAFGSIMVGFSNYSYEPSLSTRFAAGKDDIEYADVLKVFCDKLREIGADIEFLQRHMKRFEHQPSAKVHRRSYLEGAELLKSSSVDVLVTSPPYLNNYHYVRNTRPQLYWLDLIDGNGDLKRLEEQNFGQFWQTVRGRPPIELTFELPELQEVLQSIRERNREKGSYGGNGWANYAATYFNDCDRFFKVTRRVMKPGGWVVIVIGNNIVQGIHVETDRFLAQIGELNGFRIEGMHRVRSKRTGSSIVNSSVRAGITKKRTELYETAVELRAPE